MKTLPQPTAPGLQERPGPSVVIAGPAGATPNSTPPLVVSPQWRWHHRTLLSLRERLVGEHVRHTQEAIAPADLAGADLIDATEELLERNARWRELAAESDQLFEVDSALQRLRDGLYGICEETGRAIPADRLRAIPWARYCRSAAEDHEHHVPRKPGSHR